MGFVIPDKLDSIAGNNRFSKTQRLLKPADYQKVYQTKRWGKNALFTFNIAPSNNQTVRLGVTVSKKVSKQAVTRNRIKRQIKEFFRKHQSQLEHVDVVITARFGCAEASNLQMRKALLDLWKKILKNQSRL